MIIEPTEEMLRAGQEALFEVCPEYTIEEREDVAREVWAAMDAAAGVFGGTPKTDPDYEESEAALRASLVDRLRNGPAPINDPDLNDQAADYIARHSDPRRTLQAAYQKALDEAIALDRQRLSNADPLTERINRSGPFADARITPQGAFQKMLDDAITYDKERAKRKAP
jgi:hypothetical protein